MHVLQATNKHNNKTTIAVEVPNIYSGSRRFVYLWKDTTTRICNSSSALVSALSQRIRIAAGFPDGWGRESHGLSTKEEVKRPERPPARNWAPEGTPDF